MSHFSNLQVSTSSLRPALSLLWGRLPSAMLGPFPLRDPRSRQCWTAAVSCFALEVASPLWVRRVAAEWRLSRRRCDSPRMVGRSRIWGVDRRVSHWTLKCSYRFLTDLPLFSAFPSTGVKSVKLGASQSFFGASSAQVWCRGLLAMPFADGPGGRFFLGSPSV